MKVETYSQSSVARSHKPIVALSCYTAKEREALVKAVKAAHLPHGTPVYFGTYGVSAADAQAAHEIPGGKYAPMLAPQRKEHPVRKLSAAAEQTLEAQDPEAKAYAGQVPDIQKLSPQQQYKWGLEMGRRLRDEIRTSNFKVDSFQLDEIWPSTSKGGKSSKALLNYFRGVLEGVHLGRPQLGDQPMKGIVHIAQAAALAELPKKDPALRGEYHAFLHALNGATSQIVAEEYPPFKGDPKKLADHYMATRQLLAQDGPDGRALANKFVAGMTPGLKHGTDLGGRVPGQSVAAANRWRDEFEAEAMRDGAAGISEYSWNPAPASKFKDAGLNGKPAEMRKVLRGVARAIEGK